MEGGIELYYHAIKLRNGCVIYLPTSVQPELYPHTDMSKLFRDKEEIGKFKDAVAKIKQEA